LTRPPLTSPLRIRRSQRPVRTPRRVPPISVVPTLLTLANLICGFAALHYAAKPLDITSIFGWNSLTVAGLLIFVGMFFDSIDGSVARLTKSTSDMGAMLDCLADIVTFGVAPAFMMLQLVNFYYYGPETSQGTIIGPDADDVFAKAIWGVAAVYLCCAALRLARFRVETDSDDIESHRYFNGLPSPGAAGAVASLIVLHQHLLFQSPDASNTAVFEKAFALGIPFVTILCALAMVSKMRYAHFVNLYLAPKQDFTYIARIIVPIVFASLWPQITLAVGFTVYALSGPLMLLIGSRKARLTRNRLDSD
jgi:CDP-diacylglycerol--serine O-phosphatidyltransferase